MSLREDLNSIQYLIRWLSSLLCSVVEAHSVLTVERKSDKKWRVIEVF